MMSGAFHFVARSIPGHGLTERRCLPRSGFSGRAISLSPCSSHGAYKTLIPIKILSQKWSSRGMSYVCKAGSSGYRRNPDFSRQNKHGFSRSRNRQNEERDSSESLEDSELFSSKNGPLLSVSNSPKFQATATPGPREKEIVELFKKVQAQLRERAAIKEEKKIEETRGQGKESETVDSLLKLLRKHTTQQGKGSSSSSGSRGFNLDHHEQKAAFWEEKNTSSLDAIKSVKDDALELESPPPFGRPVSNFRRRSPVPKVKFQPISSGSLSDMHLNGKRERTHPEPEIDEPKLEFEAETEPEPSLSDGDAFDGMSDDESSVVSEGYSDADTEERETILGEDLSEMKLQELRALAKARGLKGFSKLKKGLLIELLSGGST